VRVGLRPPLELFEAGLDRLGRAIRRAEGLGLDHLTTGDHVSFRDGYGHDGFVQATALATLSRRLEVHMAVYPLTLRHPVTVARHVASLARLAPGRFVFGVGAAGDDPHEMEVCRVEPATRGARMGESLAILTALLRGETVDHPGSHFPLQGARIRQVPDPAVPLLVGALGGGAAASRAVRPGLDRRLGLARPLRAVGRPGRRARAAAGRNRVAWRHPLHTWCGFGSTPELARSRLAHAMEGIYKIPFERFERYSPVGRPEDVAEALSAYAAAGCSDVHVLPVAGDIDEALESVAAVRRLLVASVTSKEATTG
jgi:alkanesulfonate monooxygenase SsuD/methylene tetrahydromethanopterin reductase-like flavin-dependent oxidoreductase (luciferase family)